MRMYDLIIKKRNGGILTTEEINLLVQGVTDDSIPKEQIAALLMAIYFRGMNKQETLALTLAMAESGETADLSALPGITVDKHSTGGVGDKTTLIVAPIVAACGVPVAKMSGRGLGHTGGTVDKLEAVPGLCTELDRREFMRIVAEVGICVTGQSANLAPADKKLYALRDITATVENTALIAASIMSKKLAAGAQKIVLDVKYGSGAFMATAKAAEELARAMVEIGSGAGRETVALITDMNRPLGRAIGNSLEILEVAKVLTPGADLSDVQDLYELSITLAAHMLKLAQKGDLQESTNLAQEAVASGAALAKLQAMVAAQGGDSVAVLDASKLPGAAHSHNITVGAAAFGVPHKSVSPQSSQNAAYITTMDTQKIGAAASMLGAGRERLEDKLDYGAGIILHKKLGEKISPGEPLATLHTNRPESIPLAEKTILEALRLGEHPPEENPLVYKVIC